ncbi:TMEM175 family protein [Ktedonobacter robiniae]|uniref:DUF1211 domain-containing membrane protein n=1 Tax=Ktedonobacter robiniae TaxID=2778365 RepID=A0ABQ3US31_9CHLR|nr:TMEM175 family protein [Ktedonobacter robiniae]GHO55397.1 DUF1211 domain-containing membrane protein [Ktedonobacter robiniae]
MNTKRNASLVEKETGRIEAFSDGVFAIAITLLVLDLKVPALANGVTANGLGKALLWQWPSYLSFFISFATILIMWINHHGIFKLVQKSSTLFMFANGFLLLLVTIVPFPTALVAKYLTTPAASTACAVYAGTFSMINLAYNLLLWSATYQRRLLKPTVKTSQIQALFRLYLLGFPLYLLALFIAFWNAYVSISICLGLWALWMYVSYERELARREILPLQ